MKLLATGLSAALLLGGAALVIAEDMPTTAPTTQAAADNKKCPISGDDVSPKAKTVAYKDKTVGFCCDDCIAKFEKDPDKYAAAMK